VSLASRWRVPLRVARRDALRARGRSALIVAMIAVPVLGLGAVDVLVRSGQIDQHERVALELGSTADAWVMPSDPQGLPLEQSLYADSWGSAPDAVPGAVTPLAKLLPSGSKVATVGRSSAVATGDTGSDNQVQAVLADVRDPMVAGRYAFTGSAPVTDTEILATGSFLSRMHADVGSTLELTPGGSTTPRTYRVVGVLTDRDAPAAVRSVLGLPGAFGAVRASDDPTKDTYLVSVPGGVPWSLVSALNEHGYLAFSRQVVADPPPRSAVAWYADQGQGGPLSTQTVFAIVIIVLVVGLAMLEVCLLAGAAFAVGVRRQTRTVGLLASSGADAGGVRRVVLSQGLLLGLTAAVIGIPLAVLLARVGVPLLQHAAEYTLWGPFDVRPVELLGIGSVAVAAGLAAAVLPARTAARMDPVRALAGRRGQASSPRRWPLIGLGVAGLGALLSIVAAAWVIALYDRATGSSSGVYGAAALLLAGAVLMQVGLIVATPAIIGAAGRVSGRLPLVPRLALRDASRNRGRSAPAVGAVLAAVAVSSALLMNVASQDQHDRDGYHATLLPGQGQVSLLTFGGNGKDVEADPTVNVAAVTAAIRSTLPVQSVYRVQTLACTDLQGGCQPPGFVTPPSNECPSSPTSNATEAAAQERKLAGDWRCSREGGSYASMFHGDPVGDASTVTAITGLRSPAAASVLGRGGVVVFDRTLVADGKATAELYNDDGTTAKRITVPAVYVPPGPTPEIQAVWSPSAAQRLGRPAVDDSLLLSFTHPPTHAELVAANAKLRTLGDLGAVYVETGYHSAYGAGLLALVAGAALITLLATGVATGLSQADARPDHATLAAVGAAPRVRRWLAGTQSWSLALLGTVLGVLAGFVPAVALLWARPGYDVVVPWGALVLTLLIVPLLAGLGALLLTRSRLPMVHRLT
jgi:putative ABC transport system permease protein